MAEMMIVVSRRWFPLAYGLVVGFFALVFVMKLTVLAAVVVFMPLILFFVPWIFTDCYIGILDVEPRRMAKEPAKDFAVGLVSSTMLWLIFALIFAGSFGFLLILAILAALVYRRYQLYRGRL